MAKIVIIGGGVSGLSCGIYSCLSGHRAIIIERGGEVGGNLTGWNRNGHHIDNCIHWLTGTNSKTKTYKTWEELGVLGGVGIIKSEMLYTYERDGVRLSLYRDIERLRDELLKISPEDEKEIKRFIDAIRAVWVLSGTDESSSGKMDVKGSATALGKLARYAPLSVGGLAKRFTSQYIREFLESFITPYFGSLALIFVFAHFTSGNADLPQGGSLAAALRMKERFLSLGGEIRLGSEVTKINIESSFASSVTLASGEVIDADYTVVTTDPMVCYGKLIKPKLPNALKRRYESSSLMRFSSFQTAFSVQAPSLPFKGDFCFPLKRRDRLALGCEYLTLREFSHEKSFSPDGMSTLQTMLFLGEDTCREIIRLRQRNPDAYKKKKERLCEIIKNAIEDNFPILRNKLQLLDAWTPATYHRYVNSEIGSYMSFAFRESFLPTTAHIKHRFAKNLILASQWQTPPGGLPIAAERGKDAAEEITRMERAKDRRKSRSGRERIPRFVRG